MRPLSANFGRRDLHRDLLENIASKNLGRATRERHWLAVDFGSARKKSSENVREGVPNSISRRIKRGADHACDFSLMRITDDEIDALKPCNFLRRTLSVATCDDDARSGIRAVNLAHRLPRLGIGRRSHSACIQHHDIGARMLFNKRKTVREEVAPQSRSIGVRGATAKIFNRKCRHAINRNVLAQKSRQVYQPTNASIQNRPRRGAPVYRYLLIDSLDSCVIYPAAPQGWVTAGHKTR